MDEMITISKDGRIRQCQEIDFDYFERQGYCKISDNSNEMFNELSLTKTRKYAKNIGIKNVGLKDKPQLIKEIKQIEANNGNGNDSTPTRTDYAGQESQR